MTLEFWISLFPLTHHYSLYVVGRQYFISEQDIQDTDSVVQSEVLEQESPFLL